MPVLQDILKNPRWFPIGLDAAWRQIEFVKTNVGVLRTEPFLDDRFSSSVPDRAVFAVSDLLAANSAGLRLFQELPVIVHSAFCCSTLMARACDMPGKCLSLKEPDILMSLANAKRMLPGENRQAEFEPLLHLVLGLLSRRHQPDEKILLKPTNAANYLLPDFLSSDMPVLIMHSDLKSFLISILKKGEACKSFIRTQYNIFSLDHAALGQIPRRQAMTFTDLQVAAVVWQHQMEAFFKHLNGASQQAKTLTDTDFLADKAGTLGRVNKHFALNFFSDEMASVVAGDVFRKDVKFDERVFDSTQKQQEAGAVAEKYTDELAQTLAWAETLVLGGILTYPLPNTLE